MQVVGLIFFAVFFCTVQSSTVKIPPLFRENPNSGSIVSHLDDAGINYRLPNNTRPIHYDVFLSTNVHTGELQFTGAVNITLQAVEDTKRIVIHARKLKDFVGSVTDENGKEFQVSYNYNNVTEFLSFDAGSSLTFLRGKKYTLKIKYNGELRKDNAGFYLSSYKNTANKTIFLATTQFESTDARHAFPCYDEPALKATFTIAIKHDPLYTAISNMPVDVSKSSKGLTVFSKTPNMSTYLVAFVVSDFVSSSASHEKMVQRIFSRPGTEFYQEFALFSGIQILDRLADYYDVAFTLPKIDQVAVPDFAAGAMENWGVATYREEYLIYNPKESTTRTQTNVAHIISHEYCHQWFGNLVAIKWWTYLWLKEGFATMFSYKATDMVYPEWGIMQMFHVNDYQYALNVDASSSQRPLTHYVQKPNEIRAIYDAISYSKGGSVLFMWEHALTDAVFRQGLHNYLTKNSLSAAEEGDLFSAIQLATKEAYYKIPATIEEMMSTWTHQGGYPLLTVERNYEDGTFTVTQRSFYNNESKADNRTWYVPFNFAMQSKSDFRDTKAQYYLKKERRIKINLSGVANQKLEKNDWLILNKQSTGYYRINYDNRNWQLISDGLTAKPYRIHPRNRAQLMDDAYHFSSSKRLDHGILLRLMTYLRNEDQYAPWSTASAILNRFNRYLSGDARYNDFQFYSSQLVENIYEKLGVNEQPGEQHFNKFTRSTVINIACKVGVKSCLKDTNNKLGEFFTNDTDIEPNLKAVIFCYGLKQSGDNVFDFVYNKLMTSEDQAERTMLISSLGCVQSPTHIRKFIESSLSTSREVNLRVQEKPTLLRSVYSESTIGLIESINFLSENYVAYSELTPGFGGVNPLDNDIRGMSYYVVNNEQKNLLLALIQKVKSNQKVKVSPYLENDVQANMKANFDWLDQNRDPLMNWISAYRTGSVASRTMSASFLLTSLASFYFMIKMTK